MNDHRDPVVARALRELPVPEHGSGFWDELEARLAAIDGDADADADGDAASDLRVSTAELPVLAALHPEAPAPTQHRVRFLAAVAAFLVAALAAGVLLRDDDPGSTDQADGVTTTNPTALPSTTRPETIESAQAATVVAWLQALAAGDVDGAASYVGPRTRTFLEDLQRTSVQAYMADQQAPWGAWAEAPDRQIAIVEIPGAGAVAVLRGTPHGAAVADGPRVEAFPLVQLAPGRWKVEPVAGSALHGGLPQPGRPSPVPEQANWSTEPPDVVFEIETLHPDASFFVSLDYGEAVPDDDGSFDPPGELAPGVHTVLFVAVADDGMFGAVAGTFEVEP